MISPLCKANDKPAYAVPYPELRRLPMARKIIIPKGSTQNTWEFAAKTTGLSAVLKTLKQRTDFKTLDVDQTDQTGAE